MGAEAAADAVVATADAVVATVDAPVAARAMTYVWAGTRAEP
ncbi:hypothetical protein [Streptomyces albofaciens]|nr:hypothetical protein [Streptomyces albofaciens]